MVKVIEVSANGVLNLNVWQRIGASDRVLQWIEHGVDLMFSSVPEQCHLKNRIAKHEFKFVSSEIKRLLSQGAIKQSEYKPHCILPLTCVPKKNKKLRLVLDCRHINVNIDTPKFSQEGIDCVAQSIQEGDLLCTVDLQHGIHHLGIHTDYQKYLGFCWQGKFYVWTVLPFGVKCAPFIFNKCLRPVVGFLRQNGLRVVLFVDDFFQMAQPRLATDHLDFLLDTLSQLGWKINQEKSQLIPQTSAI